MMPNISQSGVAKSDCYFGSVVCNVGSNFGDCWDANGRLEIWAQSRDFEPITAA